MDQLPLIFFSALVLYLVLFERPGGARRRPRALLRRLSLSIAALCLAVWGLALLWHPGWGDDVAAGWSALAEDFYLAAFLADLIGSFWAGVCFLAAFGVALAFLVADFRQSPR